MTLREARRILGIGPDDDPRPLMNELRAARENLAALVRKAPNERLAMRHQEELVRFDRALAAVRETLVALGLPEIPHDTPNDESTPDEASDDEPEDAPASLLWRIAALIFLLLVAASGTSAWFYWKYQDRQMMRFSEKIEALQEQGVVHLESRRWEDAGEVFDEIDRLLPGSPITRLGRERIMTGIAEEHAQFISYWTGEARAALDSNRWDDAESAARNVLERFPDHPEAAAVLADIADAQLAEKRRNDIANITTLLNDGQPGDALTAATALAAACQNDAELAALVSRSRDALARLHADHARARELFANARERDTGSFDAEALEWLREAALLAPHDELIAAHLEKMAAYTRTIRVPEDAADLIEAIDEARENDRILLGPGTWHGTFVILKPIDLQGAGPDQTFLVCPAVAGCALTLGPEAKGARVSGITFRHIGFDAGEDRYSAALVRGGAVVFADCHFVEASGHGLAVIEGGRAEVQRCRLRENGWNGIAATGNASEAIVSDSQISENFGHGVEAWEGGRIALVDCRLEGNSGNGAHIDTTADGILIESCEISGNREYGIVLTAASDGRISKNRILKNLLGGIAVRKTAERIHLEHNEVFSNSGPGLILDQGLPTARYQENTAHRNAGSQIMTHANLTPAAAE